MNKEIERMLNFGQIDKLTADLAQRVILTNMAVYNIKTCPFDAIDFAQDLIDMEKEELPF